MPEETQTQTSARRWPGPDPAGEAGRAARGRARPVRRPSGSTSPITPPRSSRDFERLEGQTVFLAGRITSLRLMGKAAFLDLTDSTGRIQFYVRKDEIGDELYGDVQHQLDLGDIAGVSGFVFKTKTGEISVHVREWTLLAKSLRPLPLGKEYETEAGEEKHAGALKDPELRYRQRSVDLLVNRDSRERLLNRMKVVRAMREYLDRHEYLEVETPVLQAVAGGAAARPFLTHHNALGRRAAPADLAGTVSQAADRRRPGPGLRDRARLPQRGHLHPPQPRVHADGGLRGVCQPGRHDDAGGGHVPARLPRRARAGAVHLPGAARSTSPRTSPACRFWKASGKNAGVAPEELATLDVGPRRPAPAGPADRERADGRRHH